MSKVIMSPNNTAIYADRHHNSSSPVRSTIVRQRTRAEVAAFGSAGVVAAPAAVATTAATANLASASGAPQSSSPPDVPANSAPKSLVLSNRIRSDAEFGAEPNDGISVDGNLAKRPSLPSGTGSVSQGLEGNNNGRLGRRHANNNNDDDYDIESRNIRTSNITATIFDLKQTNSQHTRSTIMVTKRTNQHYSDGIKVNETIRLPNLNNNNDLITANSQADYAQRNNTSTNETPILSKQRRIKYNNNNHHEIDDDDDDDDGLRKSCPDARPLFVAQSSILWYVLSGGLSCYLLDLILRRLRRSKSTIQLLDVRSDCEGNLIELILSNNHRRFAHWLPGQFVYLNCPQIAAYEWHPFTISSMDNRTRQFTLHIKTGGDWTRKLRHQLELRRRQSECSVSLLSQLYQGYHCGCGSQNIIKPNSITTSETIPPAGIGRINGQRTPVQASSSSSLLPPPTSAINDIHCQITNVDCYDYKTGQLQIECKKITHLNSKDNNNDDLHDKQASNCELYCDGGSVQINMNDDDDGHNDRFRHYLSQKGSYLVCNSKLTNEIKIISHKDDEFNPKAKQQPANLRLKSLELYIDGPFHSPFERLLEQQVSVCIANGVGWTAFSSVFQRITNNLVGLNRANQDNWWSQWQNYALNSGSTAASEILNTRSSKDNDQNVQRATTTTTTTTTTPSATIETRTISPDEGNLHLLVIVTTIEQLKPFYAIAQRYFDLIQREFQMSNTINGPIHPVREVKAFITRCK